MVGMIPKNHPKTHAEACTYALLRGTIVQDFKFSDPVEVCFSKWPYLQLSCVRNSTSRKTNKNIEVRDSQNGILGSWARWNRAPPDVAHALASQKDMPRQVRRTQSALLSLLQRTNDRFWQLTQRWDGVANSLLLVRPSRFGRVFVKRARLVRSEWGYNS